MVTLHRGHGRVQMSVVPLLLTAVVIVVGLEIEKQHSQFQLEEATVSDIQEAFRRGALTSRGLVELYLDRIARYDPILHAIIEINPDILELADKADKEREQAGGYIGGLHGIPVLLKDNIGTKDKLNTTAGSFALLCSIVPRDAGVVSRLRKAGAIILGKANLSEWANIRSVNSSSGWSARGGQTKSPYNISVDPCGSSSGSAVATAANLVAVSLGSETDGSILCPSGRNGVVGIKPSVGLTSRAGVIPISHTQDSVGPICRTVTDAVVVLDQIVGYDGLDIATASGSCLIPEGGYEQFLKVDGLKGRRLGILRNPFLEGSPEEVPILNGHFQTLRNLGATVVENAKLEYVGEIQSSESEIIVLVTEFKQDLNAYLAGLLSSPVRSLADVIAFNKEHATLEELGVYDQEIFLLAEKTTGYQSQEYKDAVERDQFLVENAVDELFRTENLHALIGLSDSGISSVAAIGGYPAISVPAGFVDGTPFGISFLGLKGSEPTLIEIAYAFEQATFVRKPPTLTIS